MTAEVATGRSGLLEGRPIPLAGGLLAVPVASCTTWTHGGRPVWLCVNPVALLLARPEGVLRIALVDAAAATRPLPWLDGGLTDDRRLAYCEAAFAVRSVGGAAREIRLAHLAVRIDPDGQPVAPADKLPWGRVTLDRRRWRLEPEAPAGRCDCPDGDAHQARRVARSGPLRPPSRA
jgi:hypothetical protein